MLSATSLDSGTFVAVDIETTGSRPGIHAVLEIGAVRIAGGEVVATFSELVAPGQPIPAAIAALTGISDDMASAGIDVSDALTRFVRFAEDAVLVAHNHRFDLSFLDWEAERTLGGPLARPVLDTLSLARRLHPLEDRHNLRDLAARYRAHTVPNHRALADAAATAEVFLGMVPELNARGMTTAGHVAEFCGLGGQYELARRLVLTTDLPDAGGVYLFRGADDRVLHIGRATDLRVRVRGYFYATSRPKSPAVGLHVERIDAIPCVSPLDALLLESRLISRYRPRFNAATHRGDNGVFVLHSDTSVRYPSLRATTRRPKRGVTIGPFTSRAALENLIDLQRTFFGLRRCTWRLSAGAAQRPCDHREQGTCPMPCLGAVDAAEYGERVRRALAVFNGDGGTFREELVRRQEASASAARYEEAIRYRDGVRALDRSLSALAIARHSGQHEGSVIIEGGAEGLALLLVRHGYLRRTVRLSREELTAPDARARIRRALDGAFFRHACESDPTRFTARQIRDVFLIDSYRKQHLPLEVPVAAELDATLTRVMTAVRRLAHLPRKTHAAT